MGLTSLLTSQTTSWLVAQPEGSTPL